MLDIKQEWLLPGPFRMVGMALAGLGLYLIALRITELINGTGSAWQLIIGIGLTLVGAIIASAHYRLEVNARDKWYKVGVWLLGIRTGKIVRYQHVERIYANKVKQARRVQSFTGHQSEVSEFLYKGYMKMDNGEKVHLDTDKQEERLIKRLTEYRQLLTPVYDD